MVNKINQSETAQPATDAQTNESELNQRWDRVAREILPRLVGKLSGRYPKLRFATSVESRVYSAVRDCLEKELDGRFEYRSDAELESYISMTACSKLLNKLKKERLNRRSPFELVEAELEQVVDSSCEEAADEFVAFRESLGDQAEMLVLDLRLEGLTIPEIATKMRWPKTVVESIRKSIERKAKLRKQADFE